VVSAVPTQVRAEGLTERMGDIILQCSGSNPGAVLAGNLSVFLPISITNRVDSTSTNLTHDVILSVDYGLGPVPTGIAGLISNQIIAFNGLSITVPSSGNLTIRISNLRGAIHESGVVQPQAIRAQLIFSAPVSIPIDQPQPVVAFAQTGLFATFADRGITCTGSPLPSSAINVATLFAAGTAFVSTRITEGFGGAFLPRAQGEDNGTRFLVQYSGFPANTHVYVPDAVAGSDALTPTAGGDLGYRAQIGQYAPNSGTLLLVRVLGADSNGAGGSLIPLPPSLSGVLNLASVSEVPLNGGAGYAVYEVVDASPTRLASAQFPTFIGISNITAAAVAQETVSFAPVSNVTTASPTAPIQRFAQSTPPSDCNLVGDCGAAYFPKLNVPATTSIQLTAVSGGAQSGPAGYIPIQNAGGGVMNWTASINYVSGSGWLNLDNTSGVNYGSLIVTANGKGLAPGTYQANVVIDGGSAGTVTIPVTLTVTAAPPVQPTSQVVVNKVVNAATFDATPLVGGSLGTLMGSHLAGKNVAVTFDGSPATLLYTSDSQINLQVPDLGSKSSASMMVTVDGTNSVPVTVPLSPAWPAVFSNGVLNQDNSVNAAAAGAKDGSILQIFATGIPAAASVSVQIAGRKDLVPLYAGPAPTVPGVQQINVAVPDGVAASTTQLVICADVGGQHYCSAGSPLVIQ
jgi:uncharacterized protein (TIGR03437 family)